MTFTYWIEGGGTVSKMRLELGDMLESPDGMLPEGANFEDEELTYFYNQEGSLRGGVARAFEAAAARWAAYPSEIRMGPESQKIPASQYFAERAAYIRKEILRRGAAGVGSRAVTRADAYSDDYDNVTS